MRKVDRLLGRERSVSTSGTARLFQECRRHFWTFGRGVWTLLARRIYIFYTLSNPGDLKWNRGLWERLGQPRRGVSVSQPREGRSELGRGLRESKIPEPTRQISDFGLKLEISRRRECWIWDFGLQIQIQVIFCPLFFAVDRRLSLLRRNPPRPFAPPRTGLRIPRFSHGSLCSIV